MAGCWLCVAYPARLKKNSVPNSVFWRQGIFVVQNFYVTSFPLVTLAAINYNNGPFVIETLESIRAQTYANTELIVVDDCSTDGSDALIADWLKTYDKPHRFIRHDVNRGVCAASNTALAQVRGKYVSGLATDDTIMPDKIRRQVLLLEDAPANAGVVYSDAALMKEDGSPRYGTFMQRRFDFEDAPSGDVLPDLLRGNFILSLTCLVKAECYQKAGFFDETLRYEDYDMWLRIAKHYRFIYSDFISGTYRIRKGSLMTAINNWNSSNIKIYLKHVADYPPIMLNLRQYAKKVYTEGDADAFSLLHASPARNDEFIKAVLQLQRWKVPATIGRKLLNRRFKYSAKY